MLIVLLRDRDGVVHQALDEGGTVCGGGYRTRVGTGAVTCLACLHPSPEHDCGHADAVIRNCPMAYDAHNNDEQRCKCCDDCAKSCADDV